jgi:hypothetical protein
MHHGHGLGSQIEEDLEEGLEEGPVVEIEDELEFLGGAGDGPGEGDGDERGLDLVRPDLEGERQLGGRPVGEDGRLVGGEEGDVNAVGDVFGDPGGVGAEVNIVGVVEFVERSLAGDLDEVRLLELEGEGEVGGGEPGVDAGDRGGVRRGGESDPAEGDELKETVSHEQKDQAAGVSGLSTARVATVAS